MASFVDSKFFLNLEQESEEEMDGSIETVFQNQLCLMSKDNTGYVKNLREQLKKMDKLKNRQ